MQSKYLQICYVVHDMNQAMLNWAAIGAGPFYTAHSSVLPEFNYRNSVGRDTFIAARGFHNSTQIEFIQPTNAAPSIFREVLDTRGPGLHHYQPDCCPLSAEQFDQCYARYERMGLKPALSWVAPRSGRTVFFDALEKLGFFIELTERSAGSHKSNMLMYQEHLEWDGQEPIRTWESYLQRYGKIDDHMGPVRAG